MPPNEIDIHRLIWSPDDIQDGAVLQSAFRKDDLKGNGAHVSVSRVDQICVDAEMSVAESQASKADGSSFVRDDAMSALLNCGQVRQLLDDQNLRPFEVRAKPIASNPAHCGIHNVSGTISRGYINQLRTLLAEAVRETMRLEILLQR